MSRYNEGTPTCLSYIGVWTKRLTHGCCRWNGIQLKGFLTEQDEVIEVKWQEKVFPGKAKPKRRKKSRKKKKPKGKTRKKEKGSKKRKKDQAGKEL